MRTRFSPRWTSSSEIPLSFTNWMSSLISSTVIVTLNAILNYYQFLRCRRQNLTACLGDEYSIFDADSTGAFNIRARFDRDRHPSLKKSAVPLAESWIFVDL